MVSGASKRGKNYQFFNILKVNPEIGSFFKGWTTWTTAAVDKRVFAAAPIVMDMLNLNHNFHNHFTSLG